MSSLRDLVRSLADLHRTFVLGNLMPPLRGWSGVVRAASSSATLRAGSRFASRTATARAKSIVCDNSMSKPSVGTDSDRAHGGQALVCLKRRSQHSNLNMERVRDSAEETDF